jgi:hypothetical protein
LARPPGGKDSSFGNKSNCSKVIAGYFRYVVELVGVGEVPCADGGGSSVDFDGCNGFRPGPLKGEGEAADAVEQGHHG